MSNEEVELLEPVAATQGLALPDASDQDDYASALAELGVTPGQVRAESEQTEDMRPMPRGFGHLVVKPSSIEGVGLFTERPIAAGEYIGLARISNMRTPLGRYVNHARRPNAEFRVLTNNDIVVVALEDLPAGTEITIDYREAMQRRIESLAVVSEHSIDVVEQYLQTIQSGDIHTQHALSGKCYARTIHVPAGITMVGAKHLHDHINIFVGDVTFRTETGMKRLTGFHVLPTKAGMKRVGYFHKPTSWTTVSYTELTDLAAIEEEMTDEAHKLHTRTHQIGTEQLLCLPQ